jgi:NAD(P)-dependent dehydrogenase (short-subunit alcohol dehydrogenase family)
VPCFTQTLEVRKMAERASRRWTAADIPDQSGKLIVITGGNSGIGFEAARALAGRGAHVMLAVRSAQRGQAAAEAIGREHARARVEIAELDLADLASVRRFAENFQSRHTSLPVLINNGGVMATPYRRTAQGFELQFGTNHLGHFALTGWLLPVLLATPGVRVVTVSSGVHIRGRIDFDNLDGARGYRAWAAYAQSKLANLLFAYELQRRVDSAGGGLLSFACHPGWAATNLQAAGFRMRGSRLGVLLAEAANHLAVSAAAGALPILYAATAPGIQGGRYIGPTGFASRGGPGALRSSARSYDPVLAQRLWQASEELTGVVYAGLALPAQR